MRPAKGKARAPFVWCGVATAGLGARELARLEGVLDDEERARITRLRAEPLRRDATAAHGLRRLLLASLTGRQAGSFRFYREQAGGKPRAEGLPQIDFSLTHCNGFAAAAAGAFGRIGIDAEPLDRKVEAALVAGGSGGEYGSAGGTVVAWTMKEALSKAEGSGLALGFAGLDIAIDPPRLLAAPRSFGNPAGWKLERHSHAGFTIAIAFGPRGACAPHELH